MEGGFEKPKNKNLEELGETFSQGDIGPEEFLRRKAGLKSETELNPELKSVQETLRAGIKELVVHGEYYFKEDGSVELKLKPDLDALAGLYLFDLAGIQRRMTTLVHKGEQVSGAIHIDTGEKEKLTADDDGSIFFDHHGKEKENPTSASRLVYETLTQLKRPDGKPYLESQKWLDQFTEFVTEIDNLSYPLDEKFFRGPWSNTLYGTYKVLPVSVIAGFFEKGKNPREPFTMEEAAKTAVRVRGEKGVWEEKTLLDVCNNTNKMVQMSIANIGKALIKMEKLGAKTETSDFGKIVLQVIEKDKKNKIPMGFTAVKALGYDSYVLWNEGQKSFFISSQTKNLEKIYEKIKDAIPSAKLIRGTMLLSPPTKDSNLTRDKFLALLGLKEYTEGETTKQKTPMDKETTPQPQEKIKDALLSYLTENLEVRFGEGSLGEGDLGREKFEQKRDAIKRIAENENPRETLDEAFGEGAFTPEEYQELKSLISGGGAKTETKSAEVVEEAGKETEAEGEIRKEETFGKTLAEILGETPEAMAEFARKHAGKKEKKSAPEKKLEKKIKKLEELKIRTAPEETELQGLKAELEKIKLKPLEKGILDSAEAAAEYAKTGEKMNFDLMAEAVLDNFPGLEALKKERPEELENMKKDLKEAVKIADRAERDKKIDETFIKYNLVGETIQGIKETAAKIADLRNIIGEKELTEEEKKKFRDKIKEWKKNPGKIWETKLGMGLGFMLMFFLVTMLFVVTLELAALDMMLKKSKSRGGK